MRKSIQIAVLPSQISDYNAMRNLLAKELAINSELISGYNIDRQSIDARKRPVRYVLSLTVFCDEPVEKKKLSFQWNPVDNAERVVVVGAGPAGYFAALRLIELGKKPIIIERGKNVSDRKRDVAQIMRNINFNPESNYCFGEGGAGTFSDGKLYTRSNKKGDIERILHIFHQHGAKDSLLYEAHPHIGSDKLPQIMSAMRNTIIDCGGEVHFDSKLVDILINNDCVTGIKLSNGATIDCKAVILATGHSAEDIYELLYNKHILIEAKPFALGVRVEHPQELIDEIQYRGDLSPLLPAAAYSLTAQIQDRGVYSFCMCPGGFMIPAGAQVDQAVVNGMSTSQRHTPFANSGVVVEVRIGDMGFDASNVLSGLEMRRQLERNAYINGGVGMELPAQRLDDFVNRTISNHLPPCSYIPGVISSPIHFWMPDFLSSRLREGFKVFDRKMRGFITSEAIVVGVESRSSSPIRIPRDADTLQHVQIKGLFPCGEGAGYAGGITSSAMDGENCATLASEYLSRY